MAYEPRPLDVSTNLPSFQDMLEAQKNRVSLGNLIQGGINTYQEQKNFNVANALKKAEAAKASAEAGFYGRKESLVDLNALTPDEQKSLAQSVSVDPITQQRGVPVSTVLAARQSAMTNLTKEKNEVEAKHLQTEADLTQQLRDQQEKMLELQQQLGPQREKREALQTAADVGSKAKPGLIENLAGAITSKIAPSLTSIVAPGYQAQQTGLAAQKQLAGQPAPADVNSLAHKQTGIPRVNAPLTPTSTVTPASPPPPSPTPVPVPNPAYPLGGVSNGGPMSSISDKANTFPSMQPPAVGSPQPSAQSITPVGGQKPTPVYTQEDYDALPNGALYVDDQGMKVKGSK